MGRSSSRHADEDNEDIIFCNKHDSKKASAVCLLHKTPICMSCIEQKYHCDDVCKLREIEEFDLNVLQCLKMKTKLKEPDADEIEDEMKKEFENAYAFALENLEKYKTASYEYSKKKIENLIERKQGIFNQTCSKIDEAIDLYISGNRTECANVFKDMEDTFPTTEIELEEVIPSFDAEGKPLVRAKEIHRRGFYE